MLDERDRQMRDVYPDPRTAQRLNGGNRGPAAAEGVKHNIAGIAARVDDPFKQGLRFLGGVAEAFGGLRVDWRYVRPHIPPGMPGSISRYCLNRGVPPFLGQ